MSTQHPYKLQFIPRPLLDVHSIDKYLAVTCIDNKLTFCTNVDDPVLLTGLSKLIQIAVQNSCLDFEITSKPPHE